MSYEEEKQGRKIEQLGAEIERLRARIKELEAEVARVTDFSTKRMLVSYILELEDALVEELAKQFDVDEPCPARTHHEYCDILKGLCDGFPHMWKQCPRKPEKLDAARQQLQAEGKIGPDTSKPRSWQITDERKAALNRAYDIVAWADRNSSPENRAHIATILAMLKEAERE